MAAAPQIHIGSQVRFDHVYFDENEEYHSTECTGTVQEIDGSTLKISFINPEDNETWVYFMNSRFVREVLPDH